MFLTDKNDAGTESPCFKMGVEALNSIPFSKPVLNNRAKTHLNIEDIKLAKQHDF
ncbi:MAG: hypothetical protein FWD40_11540 [Treponema sp.]|nr:hypothetical protein [Treponema sp.]